MRYSIARPGVPVIWLDTHAITDLLEAQEQANPTAADRGLRSLFDRLLELRRARRIFIFETDQIYEIEGRPELVEGSSRILSQLSQGVRTNYRTVLQNQTIQAIDSLVAGFDDVVLPFRTAFDTDPFAAQQTGRFIIRAHRAPSTDEINERTVHAEDLAGQWEHLRSHADRKIPFAKRREARRQIELVGHQDAIRQVVAEGPRRVLDGRWIDRVSSPFAMWRNRGGEDSIDAFVAFFGSDHYTALPFVQVYSALAAHIISSSQPIRRGDVMDLNHIAAAMPYCTHMVLDRSMIAAVKDLGLDSEYGTTVLRLNQLGAELPH